MISLCAIIAAWLNASKRVGVGMNRSASASTDLRLLDIKTHLHRIVYIM